MSQNDYHLNKEEKYRFDIASGQDEVNKTEQLIGKLTNNKNNNVYEQYISEIKKLKPEEKGNNVFRNGKSENWDKIIKLHETIRKTGYLHLTEEEIKYNEKYAEILDSLSDNFVFFSSYPQKLVLETMERNLNIDNGEELKY